MGPHVLGPGLETWNIPGGCRRKKRFFTCSSVKDPFWLSRGRPQRPSEFNFDRFWPLSEARGASKNVDSVQYILKKLTFARGCFQDASQRRIGAVRSNCRGLLEGISGAFWSAFRYSDWRTPARTLLFKLFQCQGPFPVVPRTSPEGFRAQFWLDLALPKRKSGVCMHVYACECIAVLLIEVRWLLLLR